MLFAMCVYVPQEFIIYVTRYMCKILSLIANGQHGDQIIQITLKYTIHPCCIFAYILRKSHNLVPMLFILMIIHTGI
jgi:hypothetical protein